jgi:phosphoribulokinase
MKKPKTITAEEFDRKVDAGEDVSEYLDLSTLTRLADERIPVPLTLPWNVLQKVEREAQARGMTREALMEAWIREKAGA